MPDDRRTRPLDDLARPKRDPVGEIRPDLPTVDVDIDDDKVDTSGVDEQFARGQARRDAENLRRINRIVVVMLENRSFDHMLGFLSLPEDAGGRGRSDVDGLTPGHAIPGVDGKPVAIRPLNDGVFLDNPGHEAERVARQIRGGAMDGFVDDFADVVNKAEPGHAHEAPAQIMGYHTPATVPVYDFLAEEFTVCDHWFSAVPGPTWPNRMFLYAGTAKHRWDNGGGSLAKYQTYAQTMPTDLIVDRLDAARVQWRIYRDGAIPWMRLFPSFLGPHNFVVRKPKVKRYGRFNNDCRQDDLPPVVFIDPNYQVEGERPGLKNDDQAPSDVVRGQELVGEVYEALRKHGQLDETLFVTTYDEHGGFHDHVPPPGLPPFARRDDRFFGTRGVRVPALVVSALVEEGSVSKEPFDHTSITHSILLRFCPGQHMTDRVAVAPNLGRVLTRTTPRSNLPSAIGAIEAAKDARSSRRGNPDPTAELDSELVASLKF